MPELPEVETIVRGLRRTVLNKKISSVKMLPSRVLQSGPDFIRRNLTGEKITGVKRRGKNIILELSSNKSILVHLGMTGNLFYLGKSIPWRKHDQVDIGFSDGAHLRYADIRKFGKFKLVRSSQMQKEERLRSLGPEPLEISEKDFVDLLHNKKGKIKSTLLNQKVIAGIGNIYADEALWDAKIHPQEKASNLSRAKLAKLHHAVLKILRKAIKAGGSSIDNYLDVEGKKGFFQFYHKVYAREGKHCPRCGTKIKRIIINQRSAHFCPNCQKKSRGLRS